jgi:hypothetical protein
MDVDVYRALAELLDGSHRFAPGDLVLATADAARSLGATAATIFVIDYEQRDLVSLSDGEVLDVDGTLGGRSYRLGEPLSSRLGVDTRLWVPLLDGADRHGVLALDLPGDVGDLLRLHCERFASLVALLLVGKTHLGDLLELPRRRRAMTVAAELRWSLLPPLSFINDQVEIAGILEPAYEVAGDTFDYAVNDDIVHLAVFDAMGHGLEASRMANLAVVVYRACRCRGDDLVATLRAIDASIVEEFGEDSLVTGQLGRLDLLDGKLELVSAGHPRPLLVRRDRVVGEVPCAFTFPLGFGDVDVETTTISLEPGDRIAFYTDGIIEARSPSGEEFGIGRLGDHITRAVAAREVLAETVRRLVHDVQAHEAGQLRDDATILLVGWPNET